MLDLERVDLRSLAEALEDHSPETMWWFDPSTGETGQAARRCGGC